MMPYYSEMPPGNIGVSATTFCVTGVLLCTALVPYLSLGFFGAALWGPAAIDNGNVLLNDIYGEAKDGVVSCPSPAQVRAAHGRQGRRSWWLQARGGTS